MVGKVKHVRQKLHQEAVKLHGPHILTQTSGTELSQSPLELHNTPAAPPVDKEPTQGERQTISQSFFPSGIFAATKISAESLVQTLSFEERPQVQPSNTGPVEKKLKSKKEKMKERRERWLSKISFIRQAKEKQAAEAWRRATPVVGDLRPLVDALPELCQLIRPPAALGSRRKTRKNKTPMKRPEPTDFSQMKQSQKRKLLETERSRFSDAVRILSGKQNPLLDIGEQLKKRMRHEEEQGPS
ncbi:ribosome biogenesis protein SLX9 homolog [Xiphophorus couchianus]|uniref:ribosome biogenesis protein SLX9 homolog n=1 Tax=Xiphophorus couchianus TaxID=32473 RepID=UPI0010171C50|nr:protein FAM207A [Xiphophorus couchianus]